MTTWVTRSSASSHASAAPAIEMPRSRAIALEPLERVEGPVVVQSRVGLGALRHPRAVGERLAAAVLAGQPAAGQRAEGQVGDVVRRPHSGSTLRSSPRSSSEYEFWIAEGAPAISAASSCVGVEVADAVGADQALHRGAPRTRRASSRAARTGRSRGRGTARPARRRGARGSRAAGARPAPARDRDRRPRSIGLNVLVVSVGRHGPRRDPGADRRLAAPAAVRVGGVEVADPELPGGVHQRERLVLGQALPEERRRRPDAAEVAAAERDAGHHDLRATEAPLLDLERRAHRRCSVRSTFHYLIKAGRARQGGGAAGDGRQRARIRAWSRKSTHS